MHRRSFLTGLATTTAAAATRPLLAASTKSAPPKIRLGMDNYSVREMGWKAPELIDYAASLKLDSMIFSDLDSLGSLDEANLRDIRRRAEAAGIALYAGSWSICPTSKAFKKNWGSAEEHLRLGIRVAKTLGSPVFRAVLGTLEDRKTAGGIQARIADTVAVLKACRNDARSAGVKIAIENHAGDMHSWELLQLVNTAGRDFVGVNYDSGNAAWTLEDPMDVLETLGPASICSNVRDNMIWETADGAAVQWAAPGDGLIDWRKLAARWSQFCPQVPILVETLSGLRRIFPYKQPDFWAHYDKRPDKFAKFEGLAKRGHEIPAFKAPAGPEGKKAKQDFQKAELEKSIAYLRKEIGLGVRS
jgi:sugar phosphate isomerase/epimerase